MTDGEQAKAFAAAVTKMASERVLGGRDRASATPAEVLELISVCAAITDSARSCLEASVADARRAGCSWTDVGRALGISRQAAFRRFGKEPRRAGPAA